MVGRGVGGRGMSFKVEAATRRRTGWVAIEKKKRQKSSVSQLLQKIRDIEELLDVH